MSVVSRIRSLQLKSLSSNIQAVSYVQIIPQRGISYDHLPVPPPAKIQLKPPPNEKGHFQYERYWSRDKRYKPQVNSDTIYRFFFHNLEHDYELWPVIFLFSVSCSLVLIIAYYTTRHIEIWFDRSTKTPPWDWSRVRDKYWKLPHKCYDPYGYSHQRLFIMEKLQDKLLRLLVREELVISMEIFKNII
ncbi:hypothetical protein Mgra_00001483 [Meloidogyne graminicola]|uniref:Uncharacterized protein n=1 Tax=Meloidogyne graminicola TaxID=189291 RepID=A0A8T0A0C6_9BILA|nr:hypothetical protein Mgra_00001483 [Meloidogyne graminicola]